MLQKDRLDSAKKKDEREGARTVIIVCALRHHCARAHTHTERREKIHKAVMKVCEFVTLGIAASVQFDVFLHHTLSSRAKRTLSWTTNVPKLTRSFVRKCAHTPDTLTPSTTCTCTAFPFSSAQASGNTRHRHLKANRHRQQTDMSAEGFMSREAD